MPATTTAPPPPPGTTTAPPPPPATGKNGADTGTGEGAEPPAPKLFKVKVDGKEMEVDEDTLVRDYQIAAASHARLRAAQDQTKKVQQFVEDFNKDPVATLKRLTKSKEGSAFREAVEKYLAAELDRDNMTAEQKALEAERDRANRLEEEKRQREAADVQHQREAAYQKVQVALDQEISDAVKTVGIPKTPDSVRRMAKYMLLNDKNQLGLTTKQIAQQVRRDLAEEHRALFDKMEDKEVAAFLGPNAEKLRRADVAELSTPPARRTARRAGAAPAPAGAKKDQPMSDREVSAWVKEKLAQAGVKK